MINTIERLKLILSSANDYEKQLLKDNPNELPAAYKLGWIQGGIDRLIKLILMCGTGKMQDIDFTISAEEAGKMLNVCAKTICRYCEKLGIKQVKYGKRFVYRLTRKNFERIKKALDKKN